MGPCCCRYLSSYVSRVLLFPKQLTLHDPVDQTTHTILFRAAIGEDFSDGRAVTETDRRSGCIDNHLLSQIARQLFFVLEQQLLELLNIAELSAVGKFAAGVDGQCVVEREFLSALREAFRQFAA